MYNLEIKRRCLHGAIVTAKSSSYLSSTAKDKYSTMRKKLAYKRERVNDSGIERSPCTNYESKVQSVGQFEVCTKMYDSRYSEEARSTTIDFRELFVGKIST
jgi:hypothetical protein